VSAAHPRRSLLLVLVSALALVVAGCGSGKHHFDATAENNGFYVTAGAVNYQLQVSRELNQYSTEDHQYLTGLPAGTTPPKPDELWYGVFLWAKNTAATPRHTADDFTIVDTSGDKYHPVALDPSANPYAWTSTLLQPLGTQPGPDTTAYFGPTQGELVLFKLNTSVYTNRPLTLEIRAPGVSQTSSISLDL